MAPRTLYRLHIREVDMTFSGHRILRRKPGARNLRPYSCEKVGSYNAPSSETLGPTTLLPPELLGEIFLFALDYRGPLVFSPTFTPVNIVHTCSYWRDIAFSMPVLWTRIHLMLGLPYHLDMLRWWLALSSDCLLTIRIHAPSEHFKDFPTKFKQWSAAFNMLIQNAHRWKDVIFSQSLGDAPLCALKDGDLRNLQRVRYEEPEIFHPDDLRRNGPGYHRFWQVAAQSPILCRASFDTLPNDLPWEQLSHVEFSSAVSPDAAFTVLPLCLRVISLSLHLDEPFNLKSTRPVVLSHCKQLRLRIGHSVSSASLQALEAPRLEHLEVLAHIFHHKTLTFNMTDVAQFLGRSGTQLKSLAIETSLAFLDPSINFMEILPFMRSVTSLYMPTVIPSPSWWQAFGQQVDKFLPVLQEMNVGLHEGDDTQLIACAISSRRTVAERLDARFSLHRNLCPPRGNISALREHLAPPDEPRKLWAASIDCFIWTWPLSLTKGITVDHSESGFAIFCPAVDDKVRFCY